MIQDYIANKFEENDPVYENAAFQNDPVYENAGNIRLSYHSSSSQSNE